MPADSPITRSSDQAVAAFLDKVARHPVRSDAHGRLVFALDATASRQPTWDRACQLQAEMFLEANRIGQLEIQLAWYRGLGEFDTSDWVRDGRALLDLMGCIYCIGGLTQIGRVLAHTLQESACKRVNTLVFVGDCVEENPDELYSLAGQLGVMGIPMLVFHEGGEPHAGQVFRELARLSRGAYCSFDASSAAELRALLNAAAIYAVGGKAALEDFGRRHGDAVRGLLEQL
jgi:hypothetical protein